MKKLIKNKKGQFIIIAFLMIAIMITSIGALMHGAVTYYKHEPWQEYLTLIGSIELNSRRLVELSLANYTNTPNQTNPNILKNNLENWQINLTRIYPDYGIALNYTLANGTNYNYYLGLACYWNKTASFSAANANFNLNIASIGLTGYKFTAVAFLNLTTLNVNTTTNEITVTVKGEDKTPITNLEKDNFQVGLDIISVTSRYDQDHMLVYIIKCQGNITAPVTVKVWDQRGIQVTAKHP
ncbi:hypothetical protein E3J49_00025 [Candidatus Bathyarchaeota archaeon]|nr:MAG: hypothetical protein E3J49_00025 [Candidatus Bathyarchaeota archaeon]